MLYEVITNPLEQDHLHGISPLTSNVGGRAAEPAGTKVKEALGMQCPVEKKATAPNPLRVV